MESYHSKTRLLDADFLNADFDSGISNGELSDSGSTSGYSSSDSTSLRHEQPALVTKVRHESPPEVMIFSSTSALCDSLQYILTMPELCDVTFLVGKERAAVHGVKAILATRSRRSEIYLDYRALALGTWSKDRIPSVDPFSDCVLLHF
ncbi:uncharacterized protein LOC121381612 [Gigantopelta aegis]|uniref:uncharacterized protein LOC121381612 n=1 Tax=Gigantopelta aegis TaxID=1735272 RepID=UPI001B88A41E|nr:uncharacterized protein LOC121381612 [Gigantopelta aegis]